MSGDLGRLAADLAAAPAVATTGATKAVQDAAEETANLARRLAPVSTGALRDSITAEPGEGGLTADVTAGADYAGFVEYGTSKMAPEPFLGPALEQQGDGLEEAIDRLVDGLL